MSKPKGKRCKGQVESERDPKDVPLREGAQSCRAVTEPERVKAGKHGQTDRRAQKGSHFAHVHTHITPALPAVTALRAAECGAFTQPTNSVARRVPGPGRPW